MAPFGPWPGDSGSSFLVDIWAAGAANNLRADNKFEMESGALLFFGDTNSGGYPGYAFLEHAPPSTTGDSRFGSNYHQRYYPVALGVGGFSVDAKIEYDPLWSGTFGNLGGLQIIDYWGARNFTSETDSGITLALAQQKMSEVSGFFDGPLAYPTPGFNSGASEHMQIDLWNDFTGGFFTHSALDLNGYGQPVFNVISKAQGVITAGLVMSWWPGPSPLALDGIGIFFTNGTNDPPLGVIANRLLTTGTNGPTQLAFYTSSAPGTLGGPIATMDWTNGIQFNAPVALQTGLTSINTEVDMTVVGQTTLAPAIPGKTFVPLRFFTAAMTANTGTSTVAGSISIGNNGTFDNLMSVTTGANFIATAWTNGGPGSLNETSFTSSPLPIVSNSSSALICNVITPPTGPTVCKARFCITGFYI